MGWFEDIIVCCSLDGFLENVCNYVCCVGELVGVCIFIFLVGFGCE